jgi:hypothetical protein
VLLRRPPDRPRLRNHAAGWHQGLDLNDNGNNNRR